MVLFISEVKEGSCGWAVLWGLPFPLNHAIAPGGKPVLPSSASPACTPNQLEILLQCRLWLSRTSVGPKSLHFSEAPRWCWWLWSGDPTLSNKRLGYNVEDTSLSYFFRSVLFCFWNVYVSKASNRNYWQKSELDSSCSMFFPLEMPVHLFVWFCPWHWKPRLILELFKTAKLHCVLNCWFFTNSFWGLNGFGLWCNG